MFALLVKVKTGGYMPWLLLWLPSASGLAVEATMNDPVVIRNLKEPGSFDVENTGPDIQVRWRIETQKKKQGAWSPVASDVRLLEHCGEPPASDCIVLKHGEKPRPMAWDGYTCNRHCP